MVPGLKEKVLGLMGEEGYNPLKKEQLALIFDIHSTEMPMFYNFLDELYQDGYIYKTQKGKYVLPSEVGLFVGKLTTHPKGFGFVISDEVGSKDLFIPADAMNGAMHNDRVMAKITLIGTEKKRAEGEIIEIIDRAIKEVVGTYESSSNFGFVVPDNKRFNKDIYIPKALSNKAKDGDKVVCEITQWPSPGRNPEGKIIEILGQKGERGVDILSVIRQHGLPEEFPRKVLDEAEAIPEGIPQEEINRRVDLRDMVIFTIDGEDAKDLDDAISIEVLPNNNYKLGVHIADVTHYVKEHNKLDKEAIKRGTSVYLVDKVVPMLPPKLSNGVCSLNPFEDKLTLSIFMEINNNGKVVNYEIVESVINSKARMTYTEVSNILENKDEKLMKTFESLVDHFENSEKLARILMKRREIRGAIDFDFPEAKIILNKEGEVVDIKKYERRISNKIIEEFMLISNETIAEHFFWLNIPFVYRIHETPGLEKMEQLSKFISTFGYHIKGSLEEVQPKVLQDIIHKLHGKPEARAINTIMLRSLKQAKYSPESLGHFGLAAKYYSHFTSPIRRYPDLQIHRIIKEFLNNKITPKRHEALKGIVDYASTQSSTRERAADEAERDVHDIFKAKYMSNKVGQVYEGIISSVTSFGIFVELDNTVEGLIRLVNMHDDYYIFDDSSYTLIGERTKKTYKIGDKVKIKVEKVNVDFKEIDFELVEEEEGEE
jgi:ribonuclease R